MTESRPGWAPPGAQNAQATRWPPVSPVPTVTGRPPGPVGRRPDHWRVPPVGAGQPARPTYQETHRVSPAGVWAGAGITVVWFIVTSLLGVGLVSTLWVMLVASVFALGAAWLLASYGDRGAATGVAAVAGTATAVVGLVVEWHALADTWILW
jgi:hypothetical protein